MTNCQKFEARLDDVTLRGVDVLLRMDKSSSERLNLRSSNKLLQCQHDTQQHLQFPYRVEGLPESLAHIE